MSAESTGESPPSRNPSATEEIHHKLYACIEEIPTLPAVVPRILAILEDDDAGVGEIAQVISHDPSVTAKVLRVANSAYYGFSGEISTLKKAIVLIGLRMVKSLAVTIPLIHAFPGARPSESGLCPKDLWIHSLAVGTLTQRLGRRCRHPNPEALFIAGILHDVGKLVLAHFSPPLFERALLDVERGEADHLSQAESEIFGADHGTVAGLLLRRWKFPDLLIQPIVFHHSAEQPENVDTLALATLRVSDFVAQQVEPFQQKHECCPLQADDLLLLGLEDESVEELVEYLSDQAANIEAFYEAIH
ncbi:MAG TPA: HDOD domain-containing protein [Acidobacteriota bacterium]|nr:HDOD domain-containing protein [Acidobacteriota bacterium]